MQRFYHQFRLNRRIRRRKEGVDPIKSAFEQMKVLFRHLYFDYFIECMFMGVVPFFVSLTNCLNLQRVKNPPIRLDDFSSVDSMREEINEIVAFLRNPTAFQEMGARAPRVMVFLLIFFLLNTSLL